MIFCLVILFLFFKKIIPSLERNIFTWFRILKVHEVLHFCLPLSSSPLQRHSVLLVSWLFGGGLNKIHISGVLPRVFDIVGLGRVLENPRFSVQ